MQPGIPHCRRRVGRDVATVHQVAVRDRLSELGSTSVATAERELSAEKQEILRGPTAILQVGQRAGGGASLQKVSPARGLEEAGEDDSRQRLPPISLVSGQGAGVQHQMGDEEVRGRDRQQNEHRRDR